MVYKRCRNLPVCTACLLSKIESGDFHYSLTGVFIYPKCLLLEPYEVMLVTANGDYSVNPPLPNGCKSLEFLPLPVNCPKRLEHAISLGRRVSWITVILDYVLKRVKH